MTAQKVVPVVISVVVIILVAVIQEKSRAAAAILSVMPLSIPLAAWIVFSATGGDHGQTAEFVKSMLVGLLATMAFVAACWLSLRARWAFPVAIAVGFAAWGAVVALIALVARLR